MWKLLVLNTLLSLLEVRNATPILDKLNNNRQKRLLFYDEEGNLVKTFKSPYLHDFGNNIEESNPMFWNFINPFYKFVQPTALKSAITYMIPVSEAVIHEINTNPLYHNKIIQLLSPRDPIVEANSLCAGRRTQIPSPRQCNTFLNCWDGWAFEQECPAGLLFSNEGYCDYAYNVNCNAKIVQEDLLPRCNKDFEAFRNNANCHEFYVCVRRSPVKFQCPAELVYNEVVSVKRAPAVEPFPTIVSCIRDIGVCDYPHAVNCTRSVVQSGDVVLTSTETGTSQATVSSEAPLTSSVMPSTTSDKVVLSKTDISSQSLKLTQVAMSRQDAIRKLQLEQMGQLYTGSIVNRD